MDWALALKVPMLKESIEISKAANLDPLELMGRVLKGDGDDGYG